MATAGDAGGGLEVADVGLDRADQERTAGSPALAQDRAQRADLDRVAERRARAVRLDVADGPRARPRPARERRADDGLLGAAVGRGQAVAPAVLVDRGAADHGEDRGRRRASASARRFSTTTPQPSPRT